MHNSHFKINLMFMIVNVTLLNIFLTGSNSCFDWDSKNQMDCLEFHTHGGWKNFHGLPPGCAHFKLYFSTIILIPSIGNCRAYLYKSTSGPEPWQGGWIHTARGASILRSFQILFVWLTGTSLHITDGEARSVCHIKPKWNTHPTESFFS